MILIADGGSTKADWIAINSDKSEAFRVRTLGLNPAVVPEEELNNRIINKNTIPLASLKYVFNYIQSVLNFEKYFKRFSCKTPEAGCLISRPFLIQFFMFF